MLNKGTLEVLEDWSPGFYGCLFLVEKVSGGWIPVIDLSPLNELSSKFGQDGDSLFSPEFYRRAPS